VGDNDRHRLAVAVRFLNEIADGEHPEPHDPAMIRAWAVAGLREIDRIGKPSPRVRDDGAAGIRLIRIHLKGLEMAEE
jgi:hypothetical protein